MFDVAGAGRSVLDRARETGDSLEHLVGLVKRKPAAGSDVEDLSRGLRRGHCRGQKVSLDRIFYKREIAALLAVAIDGGRLALQHASNELSQHRGILRIGVLTRSKDVEVA